MEQADASTPADADAARDGVVEADTVHSWGACPAREWHLSSLTGTHYAGFVAGTVAPLDAGRVLLVGGMDGFSGERFFGDVAIYDIAADTIRFAPSMNDDRTKSPPMFERGLAHHTMTRLKDGTFLVAGGETTESVATVEAGILDTGTWSYRRVAPMKTPRTNHVAVALTDGRVMVFGGKSEGYAPDDLAEIYDPLSDTWSVSPTPPALLHSSWGAARVLVPLQTGNLLAVGFGDAGCGRAFIYDLAHDTWRETGSLRFTHDAWAATALPDGRVLVAGGTSCSGGYESAPKNDTTRDITEFFDPATETWSEGPRLQHEVEVGTLTYIPDCGALLYGTDDMRGEGIVPLQVLDLDGKMWRMPSIEPPYVRWDEQVTVMTDGKLVVPYQYPSWVKDAPRMLTLDAVTK